MTRILYVFPEPLPLPKARAIQVVNTVAALAGQGAAVDFAFVPVPAAPDPFAHYGLERPTGVRLVPLSRGLPGVLGKLRMHSNRLFLHRLVAWVRRQRRSEGLPAAIFVRHLKLAHGLLATLPEVPLVYEAHEVFADTAPKHKREKLATLEAKVLARAGAVIAISAGLARHLRARYGTTRTIPVVPSGTDLPAAHPVKPWAQATRHIVYAGSLYPWKGVDDLVAAAGLLADCEISIAGGDAAGIERLRARVPAAGKVGFLGHLAHRQARDLVDGACIAVLPNRAGSVSEFTSPLKLFEYMAAGCAIVASDLPVFREVLGNDEAVWFEPGNPESLAAAIRQLLADPERMRRCGEAMRRRAADYSWEARAAALLRIVADACPSLRTRTA